MKKTHILMFLILLLSVANVASADWKVQGNLSAIYTDGNSNTFTGGSGISANYKIPLLKIKMGADGAYGVIKYQRGDFMENTNNWHIFGGVNYYIIKDKKFFVWYDLDLFGDEFKGYWLRIDNSAGIGYSIFKTDDLSWDLKLGVDYTWDKLVNMNEDGEEEEDAFNGLLALNYAQTIREGMDWTWNARYLQDSQERENYRIEADTALTTKLTQLLSLKQSINCQYDNMPPNVVKLDGKGVEVVDANGDAIMVRAEQFDITMSLSLVISMNFKKKTNEEKS